MYQNVAFVGITRDLASISTTYFDLQPVSGTRLLTGYLSGTRLLSKDLRYMYLGESCFVTTKHS